METSVDKGTVIQKHSNYFSLKLGFRPFVNSEKLCFHCKKIKQQDYQSLLTAVSDFAGNQYDTPREMRAQRRKHCHLLGAKTAWAVLGEQITHCLRKDIVMYPVDGKSNFW